MNNSLSKKSLLSVLFSPAVGLAILGTCAFAFSFYRAGQLANLVLPKDFPRRQLHKELPSPLPAPKIDINSIALLTAIDTSNPARLSNFGEHKKAMEEALKNLTDNSPTDVANIALAGDIFIAGGNKEDKELGLALLSRAVALAPNNQYLGCRYAERMIAAGQLDQAAKRMSELVQSNPQLSGIHLILAKIFWLQGKREAMVKELVKIKDGGHLTAKEQEEAALMFVKAGRISDGLKLFQQAMSGRPEKRFYAAYCGLLELSSSDDYKTALAVIDANLASNPSSDQLPLELKQAVLLMLLDRSKEAKDILEQSITRHKNNFDLQILLSTANFSSGDPDQALASLELAAKVYQPKL